jgi:hypothetical protein
MPWVTGVFTVLASPSSLASYLTGGPFWSTLPAFASCSPSHLKSQPLLHPLWCSYTFDLPSTAATCAKLPLSLTSMPETAASCFYSCPLWPELTVGGIVYLFCSLRTPHGSRLTQSESQSPTKSYSLLIHLCPLFFFFCDGFFPDRVS